MPSGDDITIEAINEVLFKDLGFHGNNRSYYDVNNSFIDKVCITLNRSAIFCFLLFVLI